MSSGISSKSTIAKNTTLLYGRTVLIMLVSLYTSRVILQALGVEDYGIYTAIGAIVPILSIVIGPLDSAISRFLTFELGKGDKTKLKRYFDTGMVIMVVSSFLSILILETAGLWFLNHKMVIDDSRMAAANWVLHLSVAVFVFSILSSPFRAAIIAHEEMSVFAYIGILDALLKLGIAFIIKYSCPDRLIMYSWLLAAASLLVLLIYALFCVRTFEECRKLRIKIDKELFGGLFSFAGWNMFGSASMICRNQGVNIMFNLFGGPIVNAAFGIANQVNSAVGSFVNNFTTAINPSIVKSYASSKRDYMMSLVYQGAKYSFFLVFLFALPLLLETNYITFLWLGQIPEYAIPFIQLMLLHSLIESLSKTIMAGTHATGRIKTYQIVVGGFQILILPLAYFLLKYGLSPVSALIATLFIDVIALFVRMQLARGIFSLSIREFVKRVIVTVFLVTVTAIPIPLFVRLAMGEGFLRFLVVGTLSVVSTGLAILLVGCTDSERRSILDKMRFITDFPGKLCNTIYFALCNKEKVIVVNAMIQQRLGWIKHNNLGDDLNFYLLRALSGKRVISYSSFYHFHKPVESIMAIGSTLDWMGNKNATVWGTGLMYPLGADDKCVFGRLVAVRGKKTRDSLLQSGIDCPEVYGDPALLMPLVYTPSVQKVKGRIGIIPHNVDADNANVIRLLKECGGKGVLIHVRNYKSWHDVIDTIFSCEFIISSSLHGLILSDAYNIPNQWVSFSDLISGGNFKFEDYYSVVGKDACKLIITDKTSLSEILAKKSEYQKISFDMRPLLQACPFPIAIHS